MSQEAKHTPGPLDKCDQSGNTSRSMGESGLRSFMQDALQLNYSRKAAEAKRNGDELAAEFWQRAANETTRATGSTH